ncbi:hypothetical protein BV898_07471 [Hypsibius exemplaris]|uniref:Protein FAM161A n=1 Tax=Hypsibius exemplaris TaxID=2072580 RepID=A0A1W0WTE1_HYPEX|nr:hypothetical protein BV898_07471 [Hypsibius exemplaris]
MGERNHSKPSHHLASLNQRHSSLRLPPRHNLLRPLSLVEEDPDSGRDFNVSNSAAEVNSDIPLRTTQKAEESLRKPFQPSSSTSQRPTSGEQRLRAAQSAYDDIMRSLSTQWSANERSELPEKRSVEPPGPRRKIRQDVLVGSRLKNSTSGVKVYAAELADERAEALTMPQVFIPEIPLEKMKKMHKLTTADFTEKSRSDSSARAVQSLKKAMRPVRLQHPLWMNGHSSGGLAMGNVSVSKNDPGDGDEISDHELTDEESDEFFRSSSRETEVDQNQDPRYLIDELWNGYALKYIKGSAGTPKWSKNKSVFTQVTRSEFSEAVASAQRTCKVEMDKLRVKRIPSMAAKDRTDLPTVIVQKHGKSRMNDSSKGKNVTGKASAKSAESCSRSRTPSRRAGTNGAKGKKSKSNQREVQPEVSPTSSSRTWNITSPVSGGAQVDMRYRNESRNVCNRSASSTSRSSRSQSLSKTTGNGQSVRRQNAVPPGKRQVPMKLRGRSLERYKAERLEKEVSDFAEMRKQFRAHPLPAWIKNKKYDQMVEEAEERKRLVQANAAALLEQVQPFNFSEIPDRHTDKRNRLFAEVSSKPKQWRRRRPVSNHRDHEGHQHAEFPAFSYTLPRNFCSKHIPPAPSFKPVINSTVPDFARLHAIQEYRQEVYKQERSWTTVTRPFTLGETAVIRNHRPDTQTDGRNGRTPLSSENSSDSQKSTKRRAKSVNESFHHLVRPTRAFSLLTAHSKHKLNGDTADWHQQRSAEEKLRAERLRERLLERNSELSDMADMVSHFKHQAPSLEERSRDYMEEMAEVKRRLSDRPFIWERSQIEDRKKRIDARFQEILRDNNADGIFQRALDAGKRSGSRPRT